MRKPIISCAVAMVFVAISSFAAEGGRMTIASSAFQQSGNIPSKFTCDGGNASPPVADNRCSFGSENSCTHCRRSRCARRLVYTLAGLEHSVANQFHCGRECPKRRTRYKRLREIRLRWTVSALRHASVLLQSFRAGSRTGFAFRRETEPTGRSDERSCHRPGGIDGALRKEEVAAAAIFVPPKCRRRGGLQSAATTQFE